MILELDFDLLRFDVVENGVFLNELLFMERVRFRVFGVNFFESFDLFRCVFYVFVGVKFFFRRVFIVYGVSYYFFKFKIYIIEFKRERERERG